MESRARDLVLVRRRTRARACRDASFGGVVDDVHVLDPMSTDRTVEVAREHGAQVTQRELITGPRIRIGRSRISDPAAVDFLYPR